MERNSAIWLNLNTYFKASDILSLKCFDSSSSLRLVRRLADPLYRDFLGKYPSDD